MLFQNLYNFQNYNNFPNLLWPFESFFHTKPWHDWEEVTEGRLWGKLKSSPLLGIAWLLFCNFYYEHLREKGRFFFSPERIRSICFWKPTAIIHTGRPLDSVKQHCILKIDFPFCLQSTENILNGIPAASN